MHQKYEIKKQFISVQNIWNPCSFLIACISVNFLKDGLYHFILYTNVCSSNNRNKSTLITTSYNHIPHFSVLVGLLHLFPIPTSREYTILESPCDDTSAWVTVIHRETQIKFQAPVFHMVLQQPNCRNLGRKPVDVFVSASPSLSIF